MLLLLFRFIALALTCVRFCDPSLPVSPLSLCLSVFWFSVVALYLSRLFWGHGRSASVLEINYGIISTVAAAAVARCYLKFVRGVEPRSVNMSGKVCFASPGIKPLSYQRIQLQPSREFGSRRSLLLYICTE